MTLYIRKFIILFFILFSSAYLYCQEQQTIVDNRKTEADIKIEDRFVSAKFLIVAGKKQDAVKLLDTIRRQYVPNATIFFELAKLHYELKDLNQTESNLDAAIKLEPDNIWIRVFEVKYLTETGRFEAAANTLTHICLLQPKNVEYYDQLVSLYIRKKDYAAALKTLENKEQHIGFTANTILKKAEILDNWGKISEAVIELNKLTTKFPKEIKYLKLIANLLMSNDKSKDAEPYYKKILDLDPDNADAKIALIISTNRPVNEEDYLVTLTPLIKNPDIPIDIKIKELIKFVTKHASTQDTILGKQLIALCDNLTIIHPNEAKAHAIYGDVLMNNGETTAAIRQYEKTLSLNNKNFLVWEQLMYGLEAVGNFDQLLKVSLEAIDLFPNQAISYYFSGKAMAEKNELTKAESALSEASLISAGNPNIESRIMNVYAEISIKKKDFTKAMSQIDQAISLSNHKNAAAFEIKGDIFKEQNDIKNAELYWKKSKESGNLSEKLKNKLTSISGN
ncbi:MAG: tetratricopeptide repeat protein [Saprospiraceae bacterium]|nr:tetratricopeptide repeat protein [Saprospiraceae bacterium]